MKSERRHELQHNDLADWFLDTYERIAPYRNSILGVVILVIVAAIAVTFWRSHAAAQAAEAWNAIEIPEAILGVQIQNQRVPIYQVGQYVGMVEKASGQYAGTPAGEWADLLTADSYLVFGVDKVMDPAQKDAGDQLVKKSLEMYEKGLTGATSQMAKERAMFGKARALETTGSLSDAIEAYDGLNKEFPKGAYKAIADQRLEQLRRPDAAEFYKLLAEYKPKPKEKPTAGPKSKLEKIGPLPENPPEEPKAPKSTGATSVKPEASKSSAGPAVPEAPKAPLEPAKSPATKPEAPKSEPPKAEPPKADSTKPQTAAPDASKAAPEKKDK